MNNNFFEVIKKFQETIAVNQESIIKVSQGMQNLAKLFSSQIKGINELAKIGKNVILPHSLVQFLS